MKKFTFIALALALLTQSVHAQDASESVTEETTSTSVSNDGDAGLFTLSLGAFDFIDSDDTAALVSAEYRFPDKNKIWVLTPFVGAMVTTDSSVYGYAGLGYDWALSDHWYVFPSAAIGGYSDGDGKDLGHGIEFRTGIETGMKSDDGYRLGIGFHHISNAGLGDKNPGTETLTVTYGISY